MGFTLKSSYAIRALYQMVLIKEKGKQYISLTEISEIQKIPRDFLEKIFFELRDAGILTSVRGRYGGYILNKEPKDLKLSEIVMILDKPLQAYNCIEGECAIEASCAVDFVWKRVNNVMLMELSKITLQDIIENGRAIQRSQKEKQGVE